MKRRVRVRYSEFFKHYIVIDKFNTLLSFWYAEERDNVEMERAIKDAVEHSDMEMNFYAVFIAFAAICSLAWAIYEASKL